jgi:hypothetical protein
MYLDVLSNEKVTSLASKSSIARATYAECLESIITLREAEFASERELLSIEFKNYHLGLEAEDATFWSKVQTNVRKLLEILKAVASKITAYIQTVPGRIHNFVLSVANWFAKIGLEAKAKKLMELQNRKMVDDVKVKDFLNTEFGPMNFDEILLGKHTAEEAEAAVQAAQPGVGKKIIIVFTSLISSIGSKFWAKFKASVDAKLREAHEQARVAGANTTQQSGTETLQKAEEIGRTKLFSFKQFQEENKDVQEAMDLIEDAARAINAGYKPKALPSPDTILGMVKTVTNGNIEKQANGIISAVDRLKRQLDVVGRSVTAAFNRAYATKDSAKVSDIQAILSECRFQYTLYIKLIVRIDTATQRCTSNVIKWAKAAIDCYVNDPTKRNEEKVQEAGTAANNNANANAGAAGNAAAGAGAGAPGAATSDANVQDFSHIFDF